MYPSYFYQVGSARVTCVTNAFREKFGNCLTISFAMENELIYQPLLLISQPTKTHCVSEFHHTVKYILPHAAVRMIVLV